jgi:PBP1b-binding outer membrane lipoprotein LpoB
VTAATKSDNQTIGIRFRRCAYVEQNGILAVNSTQISPVMMLPSNEARFFDIFTDIGVSAVRARVGSYRADFVVTFQLIDTSTGEVVWADKAIVDETAGVWGSAD